MKKIILTVALFIGSSAQAAKFNCAQHHVGYGYKTVAIISLDEDLSGTIDFDSFEAYGPYDGNFKAYGGYYKEKVGCTSAACEDFKIYFDASIPDAPRGDSKVNIRLTQSEYGTKGTITLFFGGVTSLTYHVQCMLE